MIYRAKFTRSQKAGAAQREAERRAEAYPKLVASGRMQHLAAERGIEIMQEIAEDYTAQKSREENEIALLEAFAKDHREILEKAVAKAAASERQLWHEAIENLERQVDTLRAQRGRR